MKCVYISLRLHGYYFTKSSKVIYPTRPITVESLEFQGANFRGSFKFYRFVGTLFRVLSYTYIKRKKVLYNPSLLIREGGYFMDKRYPQIPQKMSQHSF